MNADLDLLHAGVAELGLDLPRQRLEKLLAYRDLLVKWNRAYNLTAIHDPGQMLTHHLLDSLAILPWLEGRFGSALNALTLLDAGSGAGLPGIPLAIAHPGLKVTLVDAVQKKTAFQRQAMIELGLAHVTPVHSRLEALTDRCDLIVSRAFADLADGIEATRHLLAANGLWLAMKGQDPAAELARLPADVEVKEQRRLHVPGLDAERRLIVCALRSG